MRIAGIARHRRGHGELALAWFALAALIVGLRAAFYGVAMSPTLQVLVGGADEDPLGPLPANRIALEDPLMILAALVALAIAVRHGACVLHGRR
ncbi:MAG: hypothetical protein R3D27_08190 [Hyphomicrobiaceae bacterium]